MTHWKRPWCWEGLGAGGEGDDRGWDGWMASPTWWTWIWVNSGVLGDGQGGLVCCDSWGHEESDTTERLNWTEQLRKSWDSKWNSAYFLRFWLLVYIHFNFGKNILWISCWLSLFMKVFERINDSWFRYHEEETMCKVVLNC